MKWLKMAIASQERLFIVSEDHPSYIAKLSIYKRIFIKIKVV